MVIVVVITRVAAIARRPYHERA
ncbi:MAG: hypothetical protein JWN27_4014, partial [Candidatus Eremiobacteraeota bacterium]|nr:hypothetical protein [Candidatus Eremiobacteraeota bacterium]